MWRQAHGKGEGEGEELNNASQVLSTQLDRTHRPHGPTNTQISCWNRRWLERRPLVSAKWCETGGLRMTDTRIMKDWLVKKTSRVEGECQTCCEVGRSWKGGKVISITRPHSMPKDFTHSTHLFMDKRPNAQSQTALFVKRATYTYKKVKLVMWCCKASGVRDGKRIRVWWWEKVCWNEKIMKSEKNELRRGGAHTHNKMAGIKKKNDRVMWWWEEERKKNWLGERKTPWGRVLISKRKKKRNTQRKKNGRTRIMISGWKSFLFWIQSHKR